MQNDFPNGMTVADLIAVLREMPQDANVELAMNAEYQSSAYRVEVTENGVLISDGADATF